MKDNSNNFFNMIKLNLNIFIKFEIIYKLLIGIVFIPILLSCFTLIVNRLGYKVIEASNIIQIITNPVILILLLLVIFLSVLFIFFEIISIIVIFEMSYHNKKTTLKDVIEISTLRTKNIFKWKNISLILYLLLLTPFLNFSILSSVIAIEQIPEFIIELFLNNKFTILASIGIYLLLIAFFSDWIYTLHYMVIEDLDLKIAKRKSRRLTTKKALKDHLKIAGSQFIYSTTVIGFITIGLVFFTLLSKILEVIILKTGIWNISLTIIILLFIVVTLTISNGVSYSLISSLFYQHKKEKKEKIISLKYDVKTSEFLLKKIMKCALGIILIIVGVLSFFDENNLIIGKSQPKHEEEHKIEITAHRGASINYPENSMTAFRIAKERGADWIELDVQQTKDEELIIAHDANLGRVTGYPENVSNLTLEEIKNLDCGWVFGEEFIGEQIPTLEEAIIFAKNNNIKLNIELKPTGFEKNFERKVVELIEKYDFVDQCIISSGSYTSIKRAKLINKNLLTAYIMAISIREISNLKYIDIYSVEATYIDKALVEKAHKENKEVHAWTINSEDKIKEMINLGVDNIITDDVVLGKQLVAEKQMSVITMTPVQ